MTNDEKKELLERLEAWAGCYRGYSWRNEDDLILDKLRALIAAPPPKHTMCENCLDDLEDYVWVYCDDCWQALLADLEKARPMVDELLEYWGTVDVHRKICDTDLGWYMGKLKEAGVEINPDKNPDKVSGKEGK